MRTISCLLLACLSFMGCSQGEPPYEADPVFRSATVATGDRFALELFRCLAAEGQGNITLSPASLETVLHMLREGAGGKTRAALTALPLGRQGVASSMQVESANALFLAENFRLKPQRFAAELHRAPFSDNPSKAVKEVNAWCRRKTHGMVPEIARDGDFTPLTRMVILNAVYLKERWLRPFDKARTEQNGIFHRADGSEKRTPLMHRSADFRYAEGAGWQAVALFYRRDGRLGEPGCFIGILPRGNARAFARELTQERYDAIRRALAGTRPQKTVVTLPKMEVDSGSFSLREALGRLGLADLFTPQADFSAFTEESIWLSDVRQRCRVRVSEKETEAAAVTMGVQRCKSAAPETPKEIRFTRPFIWVIGDLTSDAPPYFLGLSEEP